MKKQVLVGKNPTSVYENDFGPQEITVRRKNTAGQTKMAPPLI